MKQYAEFLGNYLHHMYFQMCSTKHLLEIKSNLAFLIQLEPFGSLIKQKLWFSGVSHCNNEHTFSHQ